MNETRGLWLDALERCCRPVIDAMAIGELKQRLPIHHHPEAGPECSRTYLEAAGRTMAGIAPWLDAEVDSEREAEHQRRVAEQLRQSISIGCDPDHVDSWSFVGMDQAIVDAAFLAQALLRAPKSLMEKLDASTLQKVIDRFTSLRARKPHFNNWLLFSACTEAALCALGAPWDRMRVDYALRQHEQ